MGYQLLSVKTKAIAVVAVGEGDRSVDTVLSVRFSAARNLRKTAKAHPIRLRAHLLHPGTRRLRRDPMRHVTARRRAISNAWPHYRQIEKSQRLCRFRKIRSRSTYASCIASSKFRGAPNSRPSGHA